jgi:hypothetical protein
MLDTIVASGFGILEDILLKEKYLSLETKVALFVEIYVNKVSLRGKNVKG